LVLLDYFRSLGSGLSRAKLGFPFAQQGKGCGIAVLEAYGQGHAILASAAGGIEPGRIVAGARIGQFVTAGRNAGFDGLAADEGLNVRPPDA
jgi:hypothetical protein